MSELKKCPFCGNTNIFVGMDWELEGRDESDGTGFYAVVCDYLNGGCGACGGYRETKDEAIIAWNKRESEVETMPNWEEVKKAYEQVKQAKKQGLTTTIKISNGKVYSMGTDNPVIRIDIKEVEHDGITTTLHSKKGDDWN